MICETTGARCGRIGTTFDRIAASCAGIDRISGRTCARATGRRCARIDKNCAGIAKNYGRIIESFGTTGKTVCRTDAISGMTAETPTKTPMERILPARQADQVTAGWADRMVVVLELAVARVIVKRLLISTNKAVRNS